MSNRRRPAAVPVQDDPPTGVDAMAVIQQYADELTQERHARIVTQCTQRQLEARVAELEQELGAASAAAS